MSKTNKRASTRKKVEAAPTSGDLPTPPKKKTRSTKKTAAAPKSSAASGAGSARTPRRARAAAGSDASSAPASATAVMEIAEQPAARPTQPVAPRIPMEPASRSSSATSSFGAGLFDDEVESAPTIAEKVESKVPVRAPDPVPVVERAETKRGEPRESSRTADPTPSAGSDRTAAGRRPKEAGRRGRGWKSRKDRLAEEAEVIAALSKTPAAEAVESSESPTSVLDTLTEAGVEKEELPPKVVILPVDDSPLTPTEALQGVKGTEAPSEEQMGGRRRRRRRGRGRRGRGRAEGGHDHGVAAEIAGEDEVARDDDRELSEDEPPIHAKKVIPADHEDWPADTGVELEDDDESEAASEEARELGLTEPKVGEAREMLINVAESEECRIAILRGGRLDELFIERTSASSNVGNIYKGRVTNVEPSIQAAFIDFGLPAHGFLHISDLHPMHFPDGKAETTEQVGKKTPRRQRPPIQNCLKRGQEVIVQVIKEGIGTKGPTLTSYISLPGRFLVMMPGMDQLGVSRKIEDDEERRRMRALLEELTLPPNIGFIVRTAGVDRSRKDLQRDLNFLVRLWRQVDKRIKTEPAPAELYKESDLVIRTIRDVFDSTLQRIVVDSPEVAGRIREFISIASPRSTDVVEVYSGDEPLFHKYGIENEIDRLHSKTVPLPSGGSLVIEQTEAMVAIDVNSGRFRVAENAEETAFRVNVEAVDEIARQLRLRDLGGLIVCDLIDMTQERHRRAVERRLADALRKHKERAKILRISRFGLLEMTRQRQRPSLLKSVFRDCPRCAGSGRVKSSESVALDVMRQIRMASNRESVSRIDVRVSTAVANDLLNRKRHQLTDLERSKSQLIQVQGVESFGMDQVELTCSDRRGRDVHGSVPHQNHENQNGPMRGGQRFQQRGRRRGGRGGRGRPRN